MAGAFTCGKAEGGDAFGGAIDGTGALVDPRTVRSGGLVTTGSFRPKALLLYLRARLSRERARAFLDHVGGSGIFDDETRPVSDKLWLRALAEFEKLAGPTALTQLSDFIIHPENLGAWSRPLRGATEPARIFRDLAVAHDGLPGDNPWRAVEEHGSSFVLEGVLPTSDKAADHARVIAALRAEAEAIPMMFGYPKAKSVVLERSSERFLLRVTIARPGTILLVVSGLVAGLLTGLVGLTVARSFGYFAAPLRHTYAMLSGGVALLLVLVLLYRDTVRHAETTMQRIRILALEREASLRQSGHKDISRPHEEPIIAGQYRVGKQLGAGATGAVWEATRLTDGAEVAIKLLRTAVVHDVRASDRLRREAEALGLSWHPNVVEVFDSGLLPSGVGYLVMERLLGETLADRLDHGARLSYEETRELGMQAAAALSAIHSAGVVHRDIKPENLFLTREGEGFVLKIIDFGVAQVSWAETRLTRSGVRIGTPGYAAPEQEDGTEVDGRSDLYALGVVLRECLLGRPAPGPGPRTSVADLSELPDEWRAFLERLTALERADRHQSAREVRDALSPLPTTTAPSSVARPPGA